MPNNEPLSDNPLEEDEEYPLFTFPEEDDVGLKICLRWTVRRNTMTTGYNDCSTATVLSSIRTSPYADVVVVDRGELGDEIMLLT